MGRYNPEMLVLAREYRGLSQTALANKTPYAQSVISRFESGDLDLTESAVVVLSRELDFPPAFFEQQSERIYGLGASFLFHRKRQALPIRTLRKIEAAVNVTRLAIARLLRGIETEHSYAVTPREVGLDGTPEQVAQLVRAEWDLPTGPITNLTAAVERAGVMVIRYDFPEKIDGLSMWVANTPPLIFLNAQSTGDRDRWTLAHELGHLVLHRRVHADIESEADRFASELLMPEREIKRELQPMSLQRAASIKLKWRVSMAALIRRAKDLGLLTTNQYEYLWKQMAMNGWRSREPNPIPPEESANLRSLLEFHKLEHAYNVDDLSSLAVLTPDLFMQHFTAGDGPRLRIAE